MNIKYLLGSFLVLLVAASVISPALAAGNGHHNSDVKFLTFKISDDEQWTHVTDGEGNTHFGKFRVSEDSEQVSFSFHHDADGPNDIKFMKIAFSEHNPDEMKLLESMNADEREAYFLARYKEHLDIEVEAGNLTQAEADEMYAEREAGESVRVSLVASGANFAALSEEELEALKDMTDDEKEAFFLEQFKQGLSEAVAAGKLTQEEADNMSTAHGNGAKRSITIRDGGVNGVSASVKMKAVLSEEEILTLQNMTADEKNDFFLSQIKVSLDADVEAGRITQEEADEIYAHHQTGSEGYLKAGMFHKTASFRTNAAITAE
ncbi:hypothetical protein MmiEs2_14780 [Methanimicrococcus stummii]|uniref:Uncharacterized protein n=1 Tax=Methanimicrococcus stummii TaxID=3028294 RepID=A0AA96VC90_9EURY|nr:hypothetical protein [Methanimicrococcus sp. Es2]WNY29253.1 hypothetical protein MmiEs2_14780 [Methanimicrococcus sp. Es2]